MTDALVNILADQIQGPRPIRHNGRCHFLTTAAISPSLSQQPNQGLDFDIEGTGTIRPDNYAFDIAARLRATWTCGVRTHRQYVVPARATSTSRGAASPGRWVYDVSLKANGVDWNLPGNYIHLPGGFTADVKTDSFQHRGESELSAHPP